MYLYVYAYVIHIHNIAIYYVHISLSGIFNEDMYISASFYVHLELWTVI